MIYLDNAATTLHKPPEVAEAVKQAILTAGNAARGAHCVSLAASRTVFETRQKLAQLFSCPREDHVVFTMNSTEALNIAIYGILSPGDHVISTDLEHNSVLRPLYDLQTRGIFVDFVPADRLGNVRYEDFEALFRENTKAIVCTHASNLTGNVLDIARISEIAHAHGALLIVDASQSSMNCPLKAETNGSGGAKNVLTRREIADCDGIIIAADKNVEMDRFDGKPVLQTTVSAGINKPQELIQKVLDGKAPIYHAEGGAAPAGDDDEKESFGHKVYKHLMNGVSHMLPFVVGGGVLIALGFLIDTLAGNANAGGNFGQTNPVAAVIFWIGKAAFSFMIPILAGYIAQSIADRPGLLPGIVGGYLGGRRAA